MYLKGRAIQLFAKGFKEVLYFVPAYNGSYTERSVRKLCICSDSLTHKMTSKVKSVSTYSMPVMAKKLQYFVIFAYKCHITYTGLDQQSLHKELCNADKVRECKLFLRPEEQCFAKQIIKKIRQMGKAYEAEM